MIGALIAMGAHGLQSSFGFSGIPILHAFTTTYGTLSLSQEVSLTNQTGLSLNTLLKQAKLVSLDPGLTTFDEHGKPTFGSGINVITSLLSILRSNSNYHLVFMLQSSSSQSTFTSNLDLFSKFLKPGDYLFLMGGPRVNPSTILQQTNNARSILPLGVNVYSLKMFFNIDDLKLSLSTLPKDFDYIGYDYEKGPGYSPEFTTNEATSISFFDQGEAAVKQYNVATGSNAKFIVYPPYGELHKSGWDWGQISKHMDAINIQMQSFLLNTGFKDIVSNTVNQIKQESPNGQLFIQVSLAPGKGTVEDNINAINAIKDLPIDGILVFYDNDQTVDLEQLFTSFDRK